MNRLTENQKSHLYRLYWEENLGTPDMAKMFGVSVPAIRMWMKKLGIPIRSFSDAQKLYNNTSELTDDLLKEMYDSGMSQEKIAKQFNITQSAIRFRMEKAGIQARSKANIGSKNGMYGRKHSPEAIQKMRESNRRQFSDPKAREHHGEMAAKQIADGRTGKSYNNLEMKVAKLLEHQGRKFIQQYRLGRYCFDFFVQKENTLVEAHGTFWHADPRIYGHKKLSPIQIHNIRNDEKKSQYATEHGYNLEIIWELDV